MALEVDKDTKDIKISLNDMLKLKAPNCIQKSREEWYGFARTQRNLLAACLGCYANVCRPKDTPNYLKYCAVSKDKAKNIVKHNSIYGKFRKQFAHEEKGDIYNGYGVGVDGDNKGMSAASYDGDVIEKLEELDVIREMMEMEEHRRHQNQLHQQRKRKYRHFNK